MTPIRFLKPTWLSVPYQSLAQAMIANLWRNPNSNFEAIENADIHKLAAEFQVKFKSASS